MYLLISLSSILNSKLCFVLFSAKMGWNQVKFEFFSTFKYLDFVSYIFFIRTFLKESEKLQTYNICLKTFFKLCVDIRVESSNPAWIFSCLYKVQSLDFSCLYKRQRSICYVLYWYVLFLFHLKDGTNHNCGHLMSVFNWRGCNLSV